MVILNLPPPLFWPHAPDTAHDASQPAPREFSGHPELRQVENDGLILAHHSSVTSILELIIATLRSTSAICSSVGGDACNRISIFRYGCCANGDSQTSSPWLGLDMLYAYGVIVLLTHAADSFKIAYLSEKQEKWENVMPFKTIARCAMGITLPHGNALYLR